MNKAHFVKNNERQKHFSQLSIFLYLKYCLPQRLKSKLFLKISSGGSPKGPGVKKNFHKTLILIFEVIMQQPKHIFEIGILCAGHPIFKEFFK